ncbi:hypothetical protein DV515_00000724, partial [Chloebia gouldiae]
YCFVFALGYLTVCQITRVYIFDYGQYSADFSGCSRRRKLRRQIQVSAFKPDTQVPIVVSRDVMDVDSRAGGHFS